MSSERPTPLLDEEAVHYDMDEETILSPNPNNRVVSTPEEHVVADSTQNTIEAPTQGNIPEILRTKTSETESEGLSVEDAIHLSPDHTISDPKVTRARSILHATASYLIPSSAKRSKSDDVTEKYDTTSMLEIKRKLISSTGNSIAIKDTTNILVAKAALKFKDLLSKPSPDVVLHGPNVEEVKISILDDDTFNKNWNDKIGKCFSASNSDSSNDLIGDNEAFSTAGVPGRMWRSIFRRIIVLSADPINAYRLTRLLQLQIDYVNPHEAHLIGEVVEAFDAVAMNTSGAKAQLDKVLYKALRNRNVGRSLVQSSGPLNILWHAYFQVSYLRLFMIASQFSPMSFPPPSENFLSARDHAANSILRQVLGPGRWFTRLVTGGREEFIVDNENAIGQNLAAEATGFEVAMRQQYGNYFGRLKISDFRIDNRLPTDESVVRTFTTSPGSTLTNNGVVHVLRAVSNHWKSMVLNPFGNFGQQRMEMLDIHLMLRFHMPIVLFTLANLRGLNSWDSQVLAPLIKELMELQSGIDTKNALDLIDKVENVVNNVCGAVPSRSEPFKVWLSSMRTAAGLLMDEKEKVKAIISSVSCGIEAGYSLVKKNKWETPSDSAMVQSILMHVKLDIAKKAYYKPIHNERLYDSDQSEENTSLENKQIDELKRMSFQEMDLIIAVVATGALGVEVKQLKSEIIRLRGVEGCSRPLSNIMADLSNSREIDDYTKTNLNKIHGKLIKAILTLIKKDINERKVDGMSDNVCKRALEFVTPRDKRTMIELIMKGLESCRPARLLLGRTKTLLQRELRRAQLDEQIKLLSKSGGEKGSVPLAESIVRAQKAFMTIELDHTRKFAYNSFMEFDDVRINLRKLQAVSQIQCCALDEARMNRLVAIRDSYPFLVDESNLEVGKQYFVEERPYKYKKVTFDGNTKLNGKYYKVPPQNMLVVGGGPSGLLTTLHCLENCLKTGGFMKLYEARDAFEKAGGTYERAQVVRLDSRWVRMLRYHLGTSFEDVWVPASGETDSHLGNTLPDQGFVEITIKDLENVLHLEISKLWSMNLIQLNSKSSAQFNYKENVMTKKGETLKVHDLVKRRVDRNGNPSEQYHSWEVVELQLHKNLAHEEVLHGNFYYLYGREFSSGGLKKFQLVSIDIKDQSNPWYKFYNSEENITIKVCASRFPTIYSEAKHGFKSIVFQCTEKNDKGVFEQHLIDYGHAKKETFVMDVGQTNIVFAIGKPVGYKDHFKITPDEPYGVCCIQGLKISLNMHNFGEKRWGDGIIDDIRSQTEQNTRVVGDFTKSLNVVPIVKEMRNILAEGHQRREDYMKKFNELEENFGETIRISLMEDVDASKWRRTRLQVRFFETGDNFYLGMEFTREYDFWKYSLAEKLVDKTAFAKVAHIIDRLWYEAAFEAIRGGDVYNPSGSKFIPKVYLIDSATSVQLRTMVVGDSFRVKSNNAEKYEVIIPGKQKVWVRSVEGIIVELNGNEEVLRESDLTRSPDGNVESRVAIATFPVAHAVSHRAVSVQKSPYWCTFPIGDGQSSPHFMRYSGLTGAAVSSMLINNYVAAGLDRDMIFSSKERILALSQETNWSNEEVIKRGTGENYGSDAFLRPGFKYKEMIEYLYYKTIEMETSGYKDGILDGNVIDLMFQNAWLQKFASALVPRGMEFNYSFITTLEHSLSQAIIKQLVIEMKNDKKLVHEESLLQSFEEYANTYGQKDMDEENHRDLMFQIQAKWGQDISQIFESNSTSLHVQEVVRGKYLDRASTIAEVLEKSYRLAREDAMEKKRISSEAENEPKSADALVTDFAVEAQAFANGLAMSAMLATISLALSLGNGGAIAFYFGIVLALNNIQVAFGTMTNVSRYGNRNEEFRSEYYNKKLPGLERALFKALSPEARNTIKFNPFVKQLQICFDEFVSAAKYYNTKYHAIQEKYKQTNLDNMSDVQNFMNLICTHFIPVVYQKEVYLKDLLWQVHHACKAIVELLDTSSNKHDTTSSDIPIASILNNMARFSSRLEASLQKGPILWGFIRKGKTVGQSVLVAPLRYRALEICNKLCPQTDGVDWRPLSTVIRDIKINVNKLNSFLGHGLKKEARDLKELFYATMESSHASAIYFVACGSFSFAILSTANNIFNSTVQDNSKLGQPVLRFQLFIRAGSALISIFAVLFALEYLLKLLIHQRKVVKSIASLPNTTNSSISKVKSIAAAQSFISVVRILAALGSLAALATSFAHNFIWIQGEGEQMPGEYFTRSQTHVGALVSLGGWILAIFLSFIVDFFLVWHLEPTAVYDICIHFKSELMRIYNDYKSIDDGLRREYTAREFLNNTRFDSVLKADRFLAIMQTILSKDFDFMSSETGVTA